MLTYETYLHVYCQRVDSQGKPELESITLNIPHTQEEWRTGWKSWGVLVSCEKVVVPVQDFNAVAAEVSSLEDQIREIEAKAFVEVKKCKDRINDLLMIGYDSGSATVTEVSNVDQA